MCAPNPVYGQGMTMSALGAVALGKFIGEQKKKKMGIWDRLLMFMVVTIVVAIMSFSMHAQQKGHKWILKRVLKLLGR